MFNIEEKFKDGKYSFNIYNHELTMEQLDTIISEMLFDNGILSYLFTGVQELEISTDNRVSMLRRFIPNEFYNREVDVLKKWDLEKEVILYGMTSNIGYYSFFAEAVMAYLNLNYLDNKLVFGILELNETLTDQRTGVDTCMYSEKNIVLGEAKFYQSFSAGKNKIITDFNNKSIIAKLHSLYRNTVQSDLIIKDIRDITKKLTFDEFQRLNIVLSGFVLHNQSSDYEYENITSVTKIDEINSYSIVFYHLPITDKRELVIQIIKKVVELIVDESK